MPLTSSFRETVQARASSDVRFRQALLGEGTQALLDGSLQEGLTALRSCINATIGFEKLGAVLGRSPKSLIRVFGPSGNPTAEDLLAVIGLLQEETGVRLQVRAVADAAVSPFITAQKPLRRKINFFNQINLICPVQSLPKKYFCFSESQITPIFPAIPSHQRGVSGSSETRGGERWTRQRRARQ